MRQNLKMHLILHLILHQNLIFLDLLIQNLIHAFGLIQISTPKNGLQ